MIQAMVALVEKWVRVRCGQGDESKHQTWFSPNERCKVRQQGKVHKQMG